MNADLVVNTEIHDLETSTRLVIEFLKKKGVVPPIREKVEELFVDEKRMEEARREADSLPSIEITDVDLQWVQVLAEGWATPLRGFMREDQYLQCQHFKIIEQNGESVNQSVPIVLPVDTNRKERHANASALALRHEGRAVAILRRPNSLPIERKKDVAENSGRTIRVILT